MSKFSSQKAQFPIFQRYHWKYLNINILDQLLLSFNLASDWNYINSEFIILFWWIYSKF